MVQTIAGQFAGAGRRFAIVQSRFNAFVTDRLREGCLDTLRRHGVAEEDLVVVPVPGAWEIPLVCQRLAAQGRFDAIIALGAVIRGDTPHFDLVAEAVARGVAQVGLASSRPVVFGVLTTDTVEQALERAGLKAGNKGSDAALAALELADLIPRL